MTLSLGSGGRPTVSCLWCEIRSVQAWRKDKYRDDLITHWIWFSVLIRDYWVLNSACTLISGASSKAGFPGFSDAANELASLKTVSNQPPSLPVTSHWPQRGPPLSCEVFQRCIWWVPTLCRLPLVHTAPPAGSAHWPRPARDRTTPPANQLLWSSEEHMGSARYESHKEYHSWLISVLTISSARAYFIT